MINSKKQINAWIQEAKETKDSARLEELWKLSKSVRLHRAIIKNPCTDINFVLQSRNLDSHLPLLLENLSIESLILLGADLLADEVLSILDYARRVIKKSHQDPLVIFDLTYPQYKFKSQRSKSKVYFLDRQKAIDNVIGYLLSSEKVSDESKKLAFIFMITNGFDDEPTVASAISLPSQPSFRQGYKSCVRNLYEDFKQKYGEELDKFVLNPPRTPSVSVSNSAATAMAWCGINPLLTTKNNPISTWPFNHFELSLFLEKRLLYKRLLKVFQKQKNSKSVQKFIDVIIPVFEKELNL